MSDNIDYKKLIPKLINAAQKGDTKAQYHLGVLYQDGKVIQKDYIQAAKYYTQAAAKGHSKAQLYLGLLYQNGRGVPKNFQQAAYLYSQSAQQGNEKAMYYLGLLYYHGKGVEKNIENAFQWLSLSASKGYPEAKKIIDEILNISQNEIIDNNGNNENNENNSNQENLINHEELNQNDNFNFQQNENFKENFEEKFENQKSENFNDLFRQELDEDQDYDQTIFFESKNKKFRKNSSSSFRKILNLIIAFSIIALIGASAFMFFMESNSNDIKNSNIINLNIPPDEPVNSNIKNPPIHVDENKSAFDVFSLAENGNLTHLQNAVANGAIFNQINDKGETPLHRAASYNKHPDSVKFIIDQGLDINAETIKGSGRTPLVFAVIHNNSEAVRSLLKAGANANLNIPGNSILSIAVKNDSPEIINLLLDSKVSPNIKDERNKLSLDYANELPGNSILKKSPVFERLKALTEIDNNNSGVIKEINNDKTKAVQEAMNDNKVPGYIFQRGNFSLNPYADRLTITGSGVRFRTEPDRKSKIITALNKGQIISYYGEWVSQSGERWVLGYSENISGGTYGWVYGQYTQLMTAK